jgi:perosamine synthetase
MGHTTSSKKSYSIPLSEPFVSGNEWKYIKECLDSGWVSSVGSYVRKFEEIVKNYTGSGYAIAVNSGTSALHLSLLASGVQSSDEVIVPTLTFIAPANVVRYCGARPVFMDCDSNTLCLDVQRLADFLNKECIYKKDGYTYNKTTGKRIKAIIPVHVFGHPVDMNALIGICAKNNIDIIEDAAESLGSECRSKKAGAFGKSGCFSFNGNKIITTGGGGMVVTDDKDVAYKIRHLSTQAKKDPFEYNHDEVGYNYRLSNIQAAMGVAQMEKLQDFIDIKRKNAALYRKLLSDVAEVEFIWEKPWAKSNFWFYTIKVPKEHKRPLMDFLITRNIQVRPVWRLMHTLPMYKYCQRYRINTSVEVYYTCINLPCSIGLKQEEIEYVADSIVNYFGGAK